MRARAPTSQERRSVQPQRLTVFPTTQKHRIPADPRPVGSARLSKAEARATSTPGAAGRGHLSIPSRTGSERRKDATTAFTETPAGQKLYPLLPSLGASPNRPATHTRHTHGGQGRPPEPPGSRPQSPLQHQAPKADSVGRVGICQEGKSI